MADVRFWAEWEGKTMSHLPYCTVPIPVRCRSKLKSGLFLGWIPTVPYLKINLNSKKLNLNILNKREVRTRH
jgi:hypothetical protein